MISASAPRVKICGLTRRADAEAAAEAGAAFLGVVLAAGYGRTVAAEHAALLLHDLPAQRVGIFVDANADEIRSAAEVAGLDVLQLHGDEAPWEVEQLRVEGRWKVWKALRPRSAEEFTLQLERYAGVVDGILLDGWSVAARGGTGERFPWEQVAPLREQIASGVWLIAAGGLRAENVARAVALLRPDAVDVSSGVESARGIKDPDAIRAFVAAARQPNL
ncbi:MAG TPA: phosphoribosylanthranilate isomerase [Longimicrobiaceae bacterium]|nr:phosphoribosylanthranilate isomerase [Longimicrobiaceae bacterium]